MDRVHKGTTSTLPDAKPPRFEYEFKDEKTLIMKYKSHRNLIEFMVGLLKGVGKFYKEDLRINPLGRDKVEIIFKM